MTVNEALQNIDVVVAAARMMRQEHDALRELLGVIAQRCKRADELEQEKTIAETSPKPEWELKTIEKSTQTDLDHIAEMIKKGFISGEIIENV